MTDLDPRLTPARGDLAAEYLRGTIEAENYVPALSMRIAVGSAPLRAEARPDAAQLTEAIFGEPVAVYDLDEGWAWVQLESDRYVGWLPEWALGPVAGEPTHRVSALRTFIFPGASIKQPPEEALTLGSHVIVEREEGMFAVLATGGYVPRQHLAPLAADEDDYVSVAERFVGAPYLWGGKTSLGLDCSGLVQVAFDAAGLDAPRDSDMQEAGIGNPVAFDGAGDLQRGDLIFWKGHVAIARGDGTIIHANAHHMAVAIEDAAGAIARIAEAGSSITSVRRL
ncbi:NlpC/P60 family protein [Flaviflagellibacter deserti]|uniref:NlpC/P60 family protein n=1 Tax=Flaviflagellibacter deserti TaxID=2267266 RepID=A0ABV9Z0B5_9HYPH